MCRDRLAEVVDHDEASCCQGGETQKLLREKTEPTDSSVKVNPMPDELGTLRELRAGTRAPDLALAR